ncbi:MAG: hypothetical protein J6V50_03540 [Clostridia bacterium]|nr:hypothetical protein [Clostridia bacterium]
MPSDTEKALRLLAYLKRFTDKSNPTSMPLIDYYFKEKGCPDFFGTPNSKRRNKRELIKKLANILNTDLYGNPLPEEDWVIVYDGYGKPSSKDRDFICNLYYNQPFSAEDVEDIMKSIEHNSNLSGERKKDLTSKVKQYISNKNYNHENQAVRNGMNPIEKKQFLIAQKRTKARYAAITRQKQEYNDDY